MSWAVSLSTSDLSTKSLTNTLFIFIGIQSLVNFGKIIHSPTLSSALPPINIILFVLLYLNKFHGKPDISKFV